MLAIVDYSSGISKSQNNSLLSLKGGELYFLTLATGSNNSLALQRAGSTVLASDSLVVEYQRTVSEDDAELNRLEHRTWMKLIYKCFA